MKTIQVFDPPLCCSSGVCGPSVDPALPRFAADLDWLKSQGVAVERFNLAQQPGDFARNAVVKQALSQRGNECLPLVLADGVIAGTGKYPTRGELAVMAGLSVPQALLWTPAVEELVAIAASIAGNCMPCLKYHTDQARALGVSDEDMARAVMVAELVKQKPAATILELADRYLNGKLLVQPEARDACADHGDASTKCCG